MAEKLQNILELAQLMTVGWVKNRLYGFLATRVLIR